MVIRNTEKRKVIKEVRLFGESDGRPVFPIENKTINAVVWRIVLKLREWRYSMGRIDTLDVVFSSVLPIGVSDYSHDTGKFHIGVSEKDLCSLTEGNHTGFLFTALEKVFLKMFCVSEYLFPAGFVVGRTLEDACAGEEMCACYLDVRTDEKDAALYVRVLDDCRFAPLLCIANLDGSGEKRWELPEVPDLSSLGRLKIGEGKVTVETENGEVSASFDV